MRNIFSPFISFIQRFPLGAFLATLALLVGLIFLSNKIGQPMVQDTAQKEQVVKLVRMYRLSGSTSEPVYMKVQAKVETNGSLRVLAQQGGIVQKVSVQEGDKVTKGGKVMSLSSTYTGGSIPSLQRQIAQNQYNTIAETYNIQKSLIQTQKQVAETQSDNAERLRDISQSAVNEIAAIISMNVEIVSRLKDALKVLEQDPQTNAAMITQTRSQIAQLEGGIAQQRSLNRTNELQAQESAPPAELARLGKEATLQQLDLQERTLNSTKQGALLQLKLAQLQESAFSPSAPKAAIVERIYVREGQVVSAGQPLYQLRYEASTNHAKLFASINSELAKRVLQTEAIKLVKGMDEALVTDFYVSQDSTDGVLYSLTAYTDESNLTNGSYIVLQVPIQPMVDEVTLLPIDLTYQSQDGAYVYVVGKDEVGHDVAQVRSVNLGQIVGSYVEVRSGLDAGMQVIMDRTVLEGDRVQINSGV